jgi:chromosomal replication initiator protein
MQFKEQFRSVDVLMVDDVQFISGKDSTQEEFFHTFNALIDQNRQIILSADKSPTNLGGMEERLRSRLNWGMVADIQPTTFELRLGILQSRAEQENIELPQKVMEYLAHKITSNVRELEGALNRLSAYSSLFGVPVTIDTVHEVLSDLLRASSVQISIDAIQREVARYYNIRQTEMHSKRRARSIVRPRQVAMYLAKNLTNCSYPQIGSQFGDRDHTTVMHAVRKVEDMIAEDKQFADDVSMIRSLLTS